MSTANKVSIEVGPELFEFTSFNNWCDRARDYFAQANRSGQTTICVDAAGRVCTKGLDFMAALFPVKVYDMHDRTGAWAVLMHPRDGGKPRLQAKFRTWAAADRYKRHCEGSPYGHVKSYSIEDESQLPADIT